MGGGALWRSTGKLGLGLGAIGTYRGIPSSPIPLAERVVTALNSAIPINPNLSNQNFTNNSTVHRPSSSYSWEVNDWEFIINEHEHGERIILDLNNMFDVDDDPSSKNLVFGSVPSLEEAKSATSDLKDAFEKLYLAPGTATERTVTFPSQPKHAFQAFELLQKSPEVQNVVAALASDENVWDAVMKNKEVMEFYRKANLSVFDAPDVGVERKPKNGTSFGSTTNGLISLMDMIKQQVLATVCSLTEFFEHIFTNPTEGRNDDSGKSIWKCTSAKGAPFIALTIAAIMVVMIKRA